MEQHQIIDFVNGWFIGNFQPSLHKTSDFEVGLKSYKVGEREASHAQKIGTEVTVVVYGRIRMNEKHFSQGDVIVISPKESSDFEALTDCALVCVKFPSLPEDKYFTISNAI